MVGGKLFSLLAAIPATEFRRMRKVFQSPFFTTNERHLVLYDLLKKHYPDFSSFPLNKTQVFKKLYPDKPFNDGLLRVLFREFTQMTEEYLLLVRLREQKLERKKMLTQIYNDYNLYPFFEKENAKLLQDLEKKPYRDWDYYQEVYELNFAYFFHPSTPKLPDEDAPLLEMMDAVDKQFALAKFRIGSEMLNRAKIYGKKYDIRLLTEVKELAATDFAKENVLFYLFSLLFQLYDAGLDEDKVVVFEKLNQAFSEHIKQLRKIDQSLFLTQLINFASKKINLGASAYYKKAFELYKIGLDADLVLRHGSIDEAVYGNIVLLGCRAGEFSWIAQFMEKYKPYLLEDIREDTYEMNKGLYFFHQKDYENAMNQFMNFGYKPRFEIKVRTNLMKTLFERFLEDKSYFDLLMSQMSAFEKYLYRNTLKDEYKKEVHLNFIAVLKKLVNGILGFENSEKLRLAVENQISKKQRMVGKEWIFEKLEELN